MVLAILYLMMVGVHFMQNRNNLLRIRLSDNEKEILQKKSKELGLDMSTYCRLVLFKDFKSFTEV